MPLSRTNTILLVGVAVAAVALGVLAERGRREPSIVDVVPSNSALLAEIDLVALRASPFGRELLESGAIKKSLDEVRNRCQVDVFAAIERLGFASPSGAYFGSDFAVVAVGKKIRARDVATCAQMLIATRGGTPRAGKHGSFATMQDGDGDRGVLAVRDAGPIVIGGSAWLSAVLDVADGVALSLRDDKVHDLPRRKVTGAFLTLSYALPDDERARLVPLLPKGAGSLAQVPSLFAMGRIDDGKSMLTFDVDASCAAGSCVELATWLDGARSVLVKDVRTTLLGARSDLEAATIVPSNDAVKIHVQLPIERLRDAWQRLATEGAPAPSTMPSGHPQPSAIGPLPSASAP